ncbi:hypothetical protein WK68_14785 [Burkholderia ubonensis]|nr:hypothetical protein WK68_14785 [Burkholderia ubonensis]
MHSDIGAQYASRAYRKLFATFKMNVSMSRRANAWDKALTESFFKTPKVESIYQTHYGTRTCARPDTSIDYLNLVDYEARLIAA